MSIETEIKLFDRDLKRFIAASFAMGGLLADPNTTAKWPIVASAAVEAADALLKELEK